MKTQETILMLDTITDGLGNQIYRVFTNQASYAFLDIETAKEYAGKVLTNGKDTKEKITATKKPLSRQWIGNYEPSKRKIEFILDACAKTGMTVQDITNLAKQSTDEFIKNVPYGTWSGITSVLSRKKKLTIIGKRDKAYVYRTVNR